MSKSDVGHFQAKPVKIQHASPIPSYPSVFSVYIGQIREHGDRRWPSDIHQPVMEAGEKPSLC